MSGVAKRHDTTSSGLLSQEPLKKGLVEEKDDELEKEVIREV